MKSKEQPFKACSTCKTLGDCPQPDVSDDMMGVPLPPDECLRPIEIMTNTLKAKKMKFTDNLKGGKT